MIDNLSNILYILFKNIGQYGPIILILFTVYLLQNKYTLLFYYIVGTFINTILNLLLKGIFKQPRPNEDTRVFELALKHSKHTFKNGIPFNIFGMPSGHAQYVFFSTAFIYFSLRNKKIFYFYLIISLITIFQRVFFEFHYVSQVIVGAIVGVLFAYYMFHLAQEKLKGKIREKKDDYGPI
jgi:undecaprenyl-diphosphatase